MRSFNWSEPLCYKTRFSKPVKLRLNQKDDPCNLKFKSVLLISVTQVVLKSLSKLLNFRSVFGYIPWYVNPPQGPNNCTFFTFYFSNLSAQSWKVSPWAIWNCKKVFCDSAIWRMDCQILRLYFTIHVTKISYSTCIMI